MYFMCMERVVFSPHSAFFKQHQRANWALTTHFVQKKRLHLQSLEPNAYLFTNSINAPKY